MRNLHNYQYILAICYWQIVLLFTLLDSWSDRWVQSEHKDDLGKFELSAGAFYGDAEKDKGIKTSQDAKFYGVSAKFDKVLNSEQLVWQQIMMQFKPFQFRIFSNILLWFSVL